MGKDLEDEKALRAEMRSLSAPQLRSIAKLSNPGKRKMAREVLFERGK